MKRSLGLSFAFFFLFFGCFEKRKAHYGLDPKQTLRVNIGTEPPTLDWSKSTDSTSASVIDNLMEGLTQFDYFDPELKVIPNLATSWKSYDRSTKWIFKIRKGVRWSDGKPFRAQHVVDGWERLLNPLTASEYAYFLYGIKNARKYNEGKIKSFSKVGAFVNEKGDLVVLLENPQSYFPSLLTHHSTYPVRKDLIERHKTQWTASKNLVTLGAYLLKIWDHDKGMVLERNDMYYGQKAKIKYILFRMVKEISTAINLFRKGYLDIQWGIPSTEVTHLKKDPHYVVHSNLAIYYFGFNVNKPPLDKTLVRKAFVHAINRKEITDLLNGGEKPLSSWIPYGMLGHEPDLGLKFDVKKARHLLRQAGYKNSDKFPKIQLAFNTNENHQRIAENIQAQIKRNLGINLELENEEWKVFLNRLKVNPPFIYRMGWIADFPDPYNFLSLMLSYSDNNHTGWGTQKFDKCVERGSMTLDLVQRKKIYRRCHQILVEEEAPVIPIYSSVSQGLISPRVKNYPFNSMGRKLFKVVELDVR